MDDVVRLLGRIYARDPSTANAAVYIRALERMMAGATAEPTLLFEIWIALLMSIFDQTGVNYASRFALLNLTGILFGEEAEELLNRSIESAEGSYFFSGDRPDIWLDAFLGGLSFTCPEGQGHPKLCPNDTHINCQAYSENIRCSCPGCYSLTDLGPNQEAPTTLCLHHYLVAMSSPRMFYRLSFSSPPPQARRNPDDVDTLRDPNDPLKDPKDKTGTLILLTIWGVRNGKRYCWWDDIVKMLDYIDIDHLRRVIRRLQDCGFIDSGPNGYTLYPEGFNIVKEALKGLPPPPTPPKLRRRRNPDEEIRTLEREYRATKDRVVGERLVAAHQRADSLPQMPHDLVQLWLEPFITEYVMAFAEANQGPQSFRAVSRGRITDASYPPRLLAAKKVLVSESKRFELPPSYFVYRPFHNIPYVNMHMEELALLHNAVHADAWRDDDNYYGDARFDNLQDAQDFIDAVVRQGDLFLRQSFALSHDDGLIVVTWHEGR